MVPTMTISVIIPDFSSSFRGGIFPEFYAGMTGFIIIPFCYRRNKCPVDRVHD
jgi:hypothetical protein